MHNICYIVGTLAAGVSTVGSLPRLLFSWIFKYWNKQLSGDCTNHHSATPGRQPPALIWLKNISFSFPLIFADGPIKCAITTFQRKCFSCNRNNLKLNYKRSIKQLGGWQRMALLEHVHIGGMEGDSKICECKVGINTINIHWDYNKYTLRK